MRRHFLPQLWLQSQRQIMNLVKWILICDISTSHNTSESYLEKYYPSWLLSVHQAENRLCSSFVLLLGKLGGLELL